MKRFIFIFVLFLAGCMRNAPPIPVLSIDHQEIPVIQSSYCWSNRCVDMISASELLKNKEYKPIIVSQESHVNIHFDYPPQNETLSLHQLKDGQFIKQDINNSIFLVPSNKGTYIYLLSGNWKQDSSSYVFALEVH